MRRLDDLILERWEKLDSAIAVDRRDTFWKGHEAAFELGKAMATAQYVNFEQKVTDLLVEIQGLRAQVTKLQKRVDQLQGPAPDSEPPPEVSL